MRNSFPYLELVDPLSLSYNCENVFYKRTGLNLEVSYLSGFHLSNETAVAIFAFSENTLFSILEFMAVCKYWD